MLNNVGEAEWFYHRAMKRAIHLKSTLPVAGIVDAGFQHPTGIIDPGYKKKRREDFTSRRYLMAYTLLNRSGKATSLRASHLDGQLAGIISLHRQ